MLQTHKHAFMKYVLKILGKDGIRMEELNSSPKEVNQPQRKMSKDLSQSNLNNNNIRPIKSVPALNNRNKIIYNY